MVRVGVIGAGFGAVGLTPAFRSIKGCEVVELLRPRSSWRAFLERGDLDAVAIAAPPEVQYLIARSAIEQGLHVFAEKPLAADLSKARELLALATENGVVHCVDFMFPDIAEWRKVRAMLDANALGACRHVTVDWTWFSNDLREKRSTWRSSVAEGGGALSTYVSHVFYYLEQLVGEITAATSSFGHSPDSAYGGEVGVDMLLGFRSGAKGCVHVSSSSPGRVAHSLVFQCERGVILLENSDAIVDGFRIRTFDGAGAHPVAVRSDRGRVGEDERVKIVRRVAERFVEACAARGSVSPSFADGVRVQELIELVRAAAISGG
jgi:predicted dehydrogenase